MFSFNFVTAQGQLIPTIIAPTLDVALNSVIAFRKHDGYIVNVREKGYSSGTYKCAYYLSNYIDFEVTYTKAPCAKSEELVIGEFV